MNTEKIVDEIVEQKAQEFYLNNLDHPIWEKAYEKFPNYNTIEAEKLLNTF